MRTELAKAIDAGMNLSVKVDGVAISNVAVDNPDFRVKSPVFEVTFPEKNVFDAWCAQYGDHPGGIYSPAVADGVWVMMKPLSLGAHTLKIKAVDLQGKVQQDVTYKLNIVAVKKQ